MKQTILFLLLFISSFTFGQTTVFNNNWNSGLPDKDTLKGLMLIQDTSLKKVVRCCKVDSGSNNSLAISKNYISLEMDYHVEGVVGYAIRNRQSDQFNEMHWMEVSFYMDEDKNPLRKGLYVWIFKAF